MFRSVIWWFFAEVKEEIWVIHSEELHSPENLQIYTQVRFRKGVCIRWLVLAKARMEFEISSEICAEVYAGLSLWKRVYTQVQWSKSAYEILGFSEVCGMKCLICFVVLLLSVNDLFIQIWVVWMLIILLIMLIKDQVFGWLVDDSMNELMGL